MATKNSFVNTCSLAWDFFASVKLALVTLCTISVTSIIGTIIPQKESFSWYVQKFGPQTAQFFDLFHLTDMFGSLWFKALLGLLSTNLIVCSIDRFPGIWKNIRADNLATPVARLTGMKRNSTWTSTFPARTVGEELTRLLAAQGWKPSTKETESGVLVFSQKGAWTRLGVFIVHASILIILVGAILGSVLGFKGSLSIPESQQAGRIQTYGRGASIDLGFEVRCDAFNIEYYPNGMPKEYRSDLTILENGREVLRKSIKVNSPLTYKGITFYQSSYEGYKDFIVTIIDNENGLKKVFITPFQTQLEWKEEQLRLGVINAEANGEQIGRIKIWIAGPTGTPSVFWMDGGSQVTVDLAGKHYLFSAKQMYATGLQVARDPGVWWVYCGCGLLLLGLFTAFFLSHQRIWLVVSEKNSMTTIFMAGSTNKNKTGFDAVFHTLADNLRKTRSEPQAGQ